MDALEKEAAAEGEDFLHEVREKFDRAAEWENDNRLRALDDVKFERAAGRRPAGTGHAGADGAA